MKIEFFPKTYQRKRTARKRRTEFCTQVPASSSGGDGNLKGFAGSKSHDQDNGGYKIQKHHLTLMLNPRVYEKILLAKERKLFDTSSTFSCFPRGPRSKAKARNQMTSRHMAGFSLGVSKECQCPTSSTTCRPARRRGRKRKTKPKNELSDSEVTVPLRIHFRGQARRGQYGSNTTTDERGKLDSATFLHYFMHIWSAFPEEKVKSVAYFDPLWFDLYANENNRVMVLNWIKEKNIFSKKYVLVPIVMWSHWSLLIFCHLGESRHSRTATPCMLLLDSLHAIGPTRLEPLIRRLLFDIFVSEEKLESKEQLKKIPLLIPKVPQQRKGEECGFYVLYYINLFLESAPQNFDISEGYPYFFPLYLQMKKDWFTAEGVESFCKRLDSFPVVSSDHDDSASVDSSNSVELIETVGS
ncbi:ubiquitin-like protease 4 isoform X1 [Sesamum indicum]|uniref:Ubiquitin-like protease 4 isoform X1 n=2 Tax=Sesamum indicum TaxID=4182 RepID=A0A6I9TCV1_SESIN|nr:ubiquitin-like protease 4 isoform X1 [Sesamum indicum]